MLCCQKAATCQNLRILAMYEAKTAKNSNFWMFWSITLLICHMWTSPYRPECTEVADFAVFASYIASILKLMILFVVDTMYYPSLLESREEGVGVIKTIEQNWVFLLSDPISPHPIMPSLRDESSLYILCSSWALQKMQLVIYSKVFYFCNCLPRQGSRL